MLILLFIIGIILYYILNIISNNLNFKNNFKYGDNIENLKILFSVISAVSMFIIICIIISYPYNIDKKLAMYEEENQKIETKIKDTVKVYMNYEQETYKNLVETSDLTTLLVAYPELNSNELVKYEIEQYKANSDKIKEIKEKQIHKSTLNWWLYFGK